VRSLITFEVTQAREHEHTVCALGQARVRDDRRRLTSSLPHHDLPAIAVGRDCDFRASVNSFVDRDVDELTFAA
jgi:hypothetical protein